MPPNYPRQSQQELPVSQDTRPVQKVPQWYLTCQKQEAELVPPTLPSAPTIPARVACFQQEEELLDISHLECPARVACLRGSLTSTKSHLAPGLACQQDHKSNAQGTPPLAPASTIRSVGFVGTFSPGVTGSPTISALSDQVLATFGPEV